MYDKRNDFWEVSISRCDVPRLTSYAVYISQITRFAQVSSHVEDFNSCNKVLTAKLLKQGYTSRYHKLLNGRFLEI